MGDWRPFFVATMPKAKSKNNEVNLFTEVNSHYQTAKEDLENRYPDFDKKDELFRSHIDESGWPYSSQIFVPHTFTALFEKMARLNGGKPRGRLIPRGDNADVIKAKVLNELLNFQWDEVSRVGDPMTARYALMDLNTRKYGAAFAIARWRYELNSKGEVKFNGPELRVLNNRDCLPNPAYSTIKNWFQYREYLTIKEMETINDTVSIPKYKNLDKLRASIKEKQTSGGDRRDTHYTPINRTLSGLSDYLGEDESPDFQILEVVTELREDRKIMFSPQHGVILMDDENPYEHGQIPVVLLKYIPIDDDIYGLSEIEPVEKLQKAMNALTSQYIDSINMDLYRILKVRTNQVQMHTLEWGPGKKWMMNNPEDVVPLEHSGTSTNQFVNVYSVLVSMFKEAMGEASAAFSTLKPFSSDQTATEIRSRETVRNVRDNFNQIFLSEAIKRQMQLWCLMDKQFLFNDPAMQIIPLRIVGRDALAEFEKMGLSDYVPDDSMEEMESQATLIEQGMEPDIAMIPRYPVQGKETQMPKFEMDETGEMGKLYLVPDDVSGNYDYIADVEPMQASSSIEEKKNVLEAISLLLNPQVGQMLLAEGKKAKISELLVDLFDRNGLKGSEKYFETAEQSIEQGGVGAGPEGGAFAVPQGAPGMGAGGAVPQEQGIPQLG